MGKKEKLSEYYLYIAEHIANIKSSYLKYQDLFFSILDMDISKEEMLSIIKNHDMSKYSKEEFEIYQKYFMPVDKEDKISELEFNEAWLHHIHNNPHHPEHWVLHDYEVKSIQIIPMPDKYIVEMICDWIAMGIKFGDTAYDWYNKSKKSIPLNNDTRCKVEKILNAIKEYDRIYMKK